MSSKYIIGEPYKAGYSKNPPKISSKLEPVKPSNSELPIGGILKEGVKSKEKYICTKAPVEGSCKGCDLLVGGICQKMSHSSCTAYGRSDKTWVIFKKYDGTTK